jgi:hypothetical protein
MLSPGYLADVNTTDADILSRDIFEKTGEEGVLPKYQASLKVDGQRVSPEDYTNFARTYGETNYDIRDALSKDEWFNSLDDLDKAEVLKDINNLSKNVGKSSVIPEFSVNSKPYEAYQSGGVEGLIDYYKFQDIKDLIDNAGDGNGSLKQDEILDYINDGHQNEAEKIWDYFKGNRKSNLVSENGVYTLEQSKNTDKVEDDGNKSSSTATSKSGGSNLADLKKNRTITSTPQKSVDEEIASLPTASQWAVSNGSTSYDLHDAKGYKKAKAAGISDDEWINAYWAANTDRNSHVTKGEAQAYIDALQGLTQSDKRAWFDYLIGTRAKNPY